MNAGLALLAHSAHRVRTLILAAAVLLGLVQVLLALGADSLQESSTFPKMAALVPEPIRQALGTSLLTMLSFSGISCLGYFHVAIVAVLVGLMIALATEPAAEAESRFVDLILSRPLRRHWIITRSIVLVMASAALLIGAMMLGTHVSLFWLISNPMAQSAYQIVLKLSLNLSVLMICWGGITMAIASVSHRRSVASANAALLAAAAYMIDLVAQVWKPLKPLSRYSPFHYYNALNVIAGSADVASNTLTLSCIAGTGFLLAYIIFEYRDL